MWWYIFLSSPCWFNFATLSNYAHFLGIHGVINCINIESIHVVHIGELCFRMSALPVLLLYPFWNPKWVKFITKFVTQISILSCTKLEFHECRWSCFNWRMVENKAFVQWNSPHLFVGDLESKGRRATWLHLPYTSHEMILGKICMNSHSMYYCKVDGKCWTLVWSILRWRVFFTSGWQGLIDFYWWDNMHSGESHSQLGRSGATCRVAFSYDVVVFFNFGNVDFLDYGFITCFTGCTNSDSPADGENSHYRY